MMDIEKLRELAENATPGPWVADPPSAWDTDDDGGYQMQSAVRVKDAGAITWDDHSGEVFKPEDAEFIAAAAPTTMLALLDRLEAVDRERDSLRFELDVARQTALGDNAYLIARAEAAEAKIAAVEAILFRHYTGSPGFERTPEHVREIDAIRDLYDDDVAEALLAALQESEGE